MPSDPSQSPITSQVHEPDVNDAPVGRPRAILPSAANSSSTFEVMRIGFDQVAERNDAGFHQTGALKRLHSGIESDEFLSRFVLENAGLAEAVRESYLTGDVR